jgi:hypothetical protein
MVGMVTAARARKTSTPGFDVVWRRRELVSRSASRRWPGDRPVPIGVDRWKTRLEMHAFTHPVGQMLAVMAFTVGGILHRFPKLRVAFLEANTGWLPFWLHRLDEHWELTPEQAPIIDRKPSEYFLSGNCFIGSDPGSRLPWVVNRPGRRGVYVGLLPRDCAFPDTVKIVAERSDLSKSAKKAMFEDNARRLYAL